MALPPELQDEFNKIARVPLVAELGLAVETQAALARAKTQGKPVNSLLSNALIAAENPQDAETLALTYAKSLSALGLVEEDKVKTLDWQTIFNGSVSVGPWFAATSNLDRVFKEAEGGVLIISEPYQCPEHMSPREFAQNNFQALKRLMDKMDEMDESFGQTVDHLLDAGKDLRAIDRQINGHNFENPRKPVIIVVGRADDMDNMVTEDPFPWNLRFAHKIGLKPEIPGPPPKLAPKNPPDSQTP